MLRRSDFWTNRLVAVTGGTGFLGLHLVHQLLEGGARIRVLSLPFSVHHPLRKLAAVEVIEGDVRDLNKVRETVAECSVIFHTAGIVGVWGQPKDKIRSVHIDGTRAVLTAAPRESRIVHTSSIMAIGAGRRTASLDEGAEFNLAKLKLPYCHAKRAAEELVLAAAGEHDVVVTNPSYLVGPDDCEPSVIGRFCVRFWKGRVPIAQPGGINLVDVRDVAAGHLLAAERGVCGQRYILGGENNTWSEFMKKLATTAGYRPRGLPCAPRWALAAAAGLSECRALLTGREPYPSLAHVRLNRYHWFYSSDKAICEIGYRSRPLANTLAETHEWFLAQQALRLRSVNRWWMRPRRAA